MKDEYRELLDPLFPLETVEYAFAYGSGAIEQAGEDKSSKMIDFILVTSDPEKFHHENIERNPKHYWWPWKFLSSKKITKCQCNYAARLYYNTLIPVGNRLIKYGVMSTEDLLTDLQDWTWLYAAGRLQKPVLDVIRFDPDSPFKSALSINYRSALNAALLQLPDTFSYEDLFRKIVNLSYSGDVRMKVAEDQKKIEKIVQGSFKQLMSIYGHILMDDSRIFLGNPGTQKIEQDSSTPAIYHRLNLLPYAVLDGLTDHYRRSDPKQRDIEEVLFNMAHRHDVAYQVSTSIKAIVANSSRNQSIKNFCTAGLYKSIFYMLPKFVKRFK